MWGCDLGSAPGKAWVAEYRQRFGALPVIVKAVLDAVRGVLPNTGGTNR